MLLVARNTVEQQERPRDKRSLTSPLSLPHTDGRLYSFSVFAFLGHHGDLSGGDVGPESLLRLHGVVERLVGLCHGVTLCKCGESVQKELDVGKGVVALDFLVQVGIEGDLLDVGVTAECHEGLAGSVGGEEDLLKEIENEVSGAVSSVILLQVGSLDLSLSRETVLLLHELADLLSSHAPRLGSEINTLTRALGHVSGSVTNESDSVNDSLRSVVLRDRMGLHSDDLALISSEFLCGPHSDSLLVLLDSGAVGDGACAHSNVVVLGEHPSVEIGGYIVSHVHLSQVLVVLHLLIGNLDSLLEGHSVVIRSCTHCLGNAGVRTICPDDQVEVHRGGEPRAALCARCSEVRIVNSILSVLFPWEINLGHKPVNSVSSLLDRPVSQVLIQNLTTGHANEFAVLQSCTNIHLISRGRDHLH
mmetsp:Transcript_14599/g.29399  ORF Transcript_14599/g.29399 Transcript_14599/m.29399 type:complete len:418 (-) Transcript_14599:489-1742(-)